MTPDDRKIRKEILAKLTVPLWPTAAKALGIGRSAAYAGARTGKIPTVGVGHKKPVPTKWLKQVLGIGSHQQGNGIMNEKTALSVVPTKAPVLILEGDPEAQLAFAQKAADALMQRVKPRKINGRDYLEFGAWQMVARFFGATVGTEWCKPVERGGRIVGYEARAVVRQHGLDISSAEALCSREEKNWRTRDEFALRSMAQTRAGAKALRNAFGWVVELAGYSSTPAEEMDEADEAPPRQIAEDHPRTVALISVDELVELRRVLKEGEISEADFCKQAKIDKLEDLEASRYQGAIGYYRK